MDIRGSVKNKITTKKDILYYWFAVNPRLKFFNLSQTFLLVYKHLILNQIIITFDAQK